MGDAAMLATLREKYDKLNGMAYRLKDLFAMKEKLLSNPAGTGPYSTLHEMHLAVTDMEEGDDKEQATQMFNAIAEIFEVARSNEGLREFAAKVFSGQRDYYQIKAEKQAVDTEMRVLQGLYHELEMKNHIARLREQQEQRLEAIKVKGRKKAAKEAAKEEEQAQKKQKTK